MHSLLYLSTHHTYALVCNFWARSTQIYATNKKTLKFIQLTQKKVVDSDEILALNQPFFGGASSAGNGSML